jgi:hypothetical protein
MRVQGYRLLLLGLVDDIEPDEMSRLDATSRAGSCGNTFEKVAVKRDTDTEE